MFGSRQGRALAVEMLVLAGKYSGETTSPKDIKKSKTTRLALQNDKVACIRLAQWIRSN